MIEVHWDPVWHLGPIPVNWYAKVSRTFRHFHAHGLVAKVPRSRRWRVTLYGRRVMELRSISGTTPSRRRIPEWPHDPLPDAKKSRRKTLSQSPSVLLDKPGERQDQRDLGEPDGRGTQRRHR